MRHHLESAEAAELSQLSAGESTPARQCFGGRMSRTSRSGSASNVTKNIITIINTITIMNIITIIINSGIGL